MVYISPARFVLFSLLSTVSVFTVISFNNVGTIPKIRSFFFHGAFWVGGGKGWEREIDGGLSLGLGRDEVIGWGWGWGWFFSLLLLLLLFSGLFSVSALCFKLFFNKEIIFARGLCKGTGVGGMGGSDLRWGRWRGGSDS